MGPVVCLAGGCASRASRLADALADVPTAFGEGRGARWVPVATSAAAQSEYLAARRLAGQGRGADAVSVLTKLLEHEPAMLEGHRLLQDLLVRSAGDWWLRRRYRKYLEAHPTDADALYLAARIAPERERQEEWFRAAVEQDPHHPYARVGLALVRERSGDLIGALREARRAAALAPESDTPWLFMGLLSLAHGEPVLAERLLAEAVRRDPLEARAHLGRAAAAHDAGRRGEASAHALAALRVAPGAAEFQRGARTLLEAAAVPADLRAAADVLAAARDDVRDVAGLALTRSRLLLAAGDSVAAEAAAAVAQGAGAAHAEVGRVLRRACIRNGRYAAGVHAARVAFPADVLRPTNRYAARWRALSQRAAAADLAGAGARELAALAEALLSVGWRREAAIVFARARAADPADVRIAKRAAEERAFDLFLGDLARYARSVSAARKAERDAPSVREILAELRRLAAARLGRDLSEGARVRSYTGLGEFAASVASEGAFAGEFDRRGLLLVVGQRRGEGPRIVLGRIVLVRAGVVEEVLGERLTLDECWVETADLPPALAGLQSGLAGLTLDRLVILQLDTILRVPPPLDPGVVLERRTGTSRAERTALDTPSAVAARIEAELARDGSEALVAAALDAVRRHELGHVLDARRLLPVAHNPLRAARLLISEGLDGGGVEQVLEARAAVTALVDAQSPRAALASLLSFLPDLEGRTAHAAGYRRAVTAAVAIIADDPRSFPSVPPDGNVLQHMDLLTPREIRELGRRLLDPRRHW